MGSLSSSRDVMARFSERRCCDGDEKGTLVRVVRRSPVVHVNACVRLASGGTCVCVFVRVCV